MAGALAVIPHQEVGLMIPTEYAKYEKVVTVSVINFGTRWGDKRANLDKMKTIVTQASELGSQMIAFPELALSGYECSEEVRRDRKPCSVHRGLSETIPGPSTLEMAKLTQGLGVYVLFGMPEQDSKDSSTHYNSVAVIGPTGILGSYRKLHLSVSPLWTEDLCFQKGNGLPVFETAFGPIGVQICQDFWSFPELSRILWLKGARIIFSCVGSVTGPEKIEFMTHETACRAGESYVYTASSNLVGKERTLSFYGHSTIAGPAYPSLAHLFAQGGQGEEIVTATLSFERLHYLWKLIDLKKMRNSELIANEFSRLRDAEIPRLDGSR